MAPSPRCVPGDMCHSEGQGERHGQGTAAGRHWQSRQWELGGAGTRLGASWARGGSRGPAWGEFVRLSPSPAPRPDHAAPPRCDTGVMAAGACRRWGPGCPSARQIRAGPERWIRLRHLPASGGGGRRGPLPDGAGSALQYFWEVKAGERWMR